MKLDSHQHFWRYAEQEYPWIPKGSALQRDYWPEDLKGEQAKVGFDGSIVVQARQTLKETRWLLELADKHPIIKGAVGRVDLRSECDEEQRAEFARRPALAGARP